MTKREKILKDLKASLTMRFSGEEIQRNEDVISLYELIKTLKLYSVEYPALFNDIRKNVNKINLKSTLNNKIPKLNAITIIGSQNDKVFITYLLDCKYNLLFIVNGNDIEQVYYDNDLNNFIFKSYLETPDEIKYFYKKNVNVIIKYITEVKKLKESKPTAIINLSSDREMYPNQTFKYQDEIISCNINMDELDNISVNTNLNYCLQKTLSKDSQKRLCDLINRNKNLILKRTPINIKDIPYEIRSYINETKLENNKTLIMHKNQFD